MIDVDAITNHRPRMATKKIRATRMSDAIVGWRRGMRYTPPGSDTRSLVERLQSWVFIAIDKNSSEVGRWPVKLYSRNAQTPRQKQRITGKALQYLKASQQAVPDDVVEVLDHPALDLFDKPNPLLSGAGFLYLVASYLQMFGECFIYRAMGGMTPVELWPLPNPCVRCILGPNNVIDKYELRIGGNVQTFDYKDMYHIRKPSPIDMISGLSQLRGILYAAESNQRMLEWEMAVYQNFAVPDLLISPDEENVTQIQVDQFTADWYERYGGWRNRGRMAVAPFKLKVDRIAQTAKDLAFIEARGWSREEIFAGFGIPISIATTEGTTFNNLHHGTILWSRNTIQPLQTTIAAGLNHQCLPDYLPDVSRETVVVRKSRFFFGFDNPVPEDEDAETDRRIKRVGAGLISYNEGRAEEGAEPVEGGDDVRIPAGLVRLTDPTSAELTGSQLESQATMLERQREWAVQDGERQEEARLSTAGVISLSELVSAIGELSKIGDKDALNLVRKKLAAVLGGTLAPVLQLEAAPSSAVVDDNKPEPAEGMPNGQGLPGREAEEGESEEDQDEDEDRPKDREKSAGGGKGCTCGDDDDSGSGDHDFRGCERWADYPNTLAKSVDQLLGKMTLDPGTGEPSLESAMQEVFRDMGASVRAKILDGVTVDLFDFTEWRERFGKAGMPFIERAFREGTIAGAADLRQYIQIAEDREAMLLDGDAIQAEVAKLADGFASKVVAVTGEQLADALSAGLEEGENVQQLADRVAEIYGAKADVASKRIARTEINSAANAGAVATWQQAGVTKHKWLASVDACEFCLTLNERVVDLGKAFLDLGAVVKGKDGGTYKVTYKTVYHPPLHPNDRCTIVPVVEGLS